MEPTLPRATSLPTGSWVSRALRSFAPVKRDEALTVVLMSVNVFLLLTCYYVLKVVREPLIADAHLFGFTGAELKSYSSAGQTLLLLAVVPAFGWLTNRVSRIRLMTTMQIIFMGCLGAFYLLDQAGAPIGLAFYLWVGVFNVLVISNFWSYANDVYTEEAGKRLFALIGVGGSLGAITGAFLPGILNNLVGTLGLMVIGVIALGCSMVLYQIVDRREEHRKAAVKQERAAKGADASAAKDKRGGFALVMRDRYLRLLALMLLVATIINTSGEYVIGEIAVRHSKEYAAQQTGKTADAAPPTPSSGSAAVAKTEDPKTKADADNDAPETPAEKAAKDHYMKGFYSSYYGVVNLVSALLQLFAVTFLITKLGLRRALFIMPIIVLGGWVALLMFTNLATVRVEKTAENSLDYSLHNTLRQALFLPTSAEAKYKAKAAIDTFFFRMGDVIAGLGIVFLIVRVLHLGAHTFAAMNIGLATLWLFLAARTGQLYTKLVAEHDKANASPPVAHTKHAPHGLERD